MVKDFKRCRHLRKPLEIGGGHILVSSLDTWKPFAEPMPDAGIYLDSQWLRNLGVVGHRLRCSAGYPAMLMDWRDMGTPRAEHLRLALRWAQSFLANEGFVEVACIGGHGRTGTFIACLLREYGFSAHDAVKAVRKGACEKCIETQSQMDFVSNWQKGTP